MVESLDLNLTTPDYDSHLPSLGCVKTNLCQRSHTSLSETIFNALDPSRRHGRLGCRSSRLRFVEGHSLTELKNEENQSH